MNRRAINVAITIVGAVGALVVLYLIVALVLVALGVWGGA